jgi:glycosyltransferase involved in cell wall biosynthesis
LRLIDAIDLVTLHAQMWYLLCPHVPPRRKIHTEDVAEEVIAEDFYTRWGLRPYQQELSVYDDFDYTLAISPQEAEVIRRHTRRTRVLFLPMSHDPYDVDNRYDGPALLPASNNPFNIQGYVYFVRKVLPLVRAARAEFELRVTGSLCDNVDAAAGVTLAGFLPDLREAYAGAGFAICPLLAATGQQVKIVEAMAHGLAVVSSKASGASSPIRHGVCGFIANDAAEFAGYVVQLYNDRGLCRQMGEAARATIAAEYSRDRLRRTLAQILPAVAPSPLPPRGSGEGEGAAGAAQ